jgi:hypothetical protein
VTAAVLDGERTDGRKESQRMAAHYNYYPPPGQVVDQSDSRLVWNGRQWTLNGKPYAVPSTHRLIGKPGGPLNGWTYDWGKHAWMDAAPNPPAGGAAGGRPSSPQGPKQPPRPPAQQPPKQQPSTPPPQKPPAKPEKEECTTMEKKPQTILEDLVKHPIAPVLGGVLVLAGYVTDEPSPPTIPDGLPEPVAKQWQMIYAQNLQRYQSRMSLYRDIGMVLLGYAGTKSIVDVIGAAHHQHALAEKK